MKLIKLDQASSNVHFTVSTGVFILLTDMKPISATKVF